jgi:cytochrome c biogenesis protein CcdA
VLYPFIFAVLPAVAWYWGTSQGRLDRRLLQRGDPPHRASALQVNILFYCVMVASVAIIGYFIHWMSDTYGAEHSTIAKGMMIAGLTATPLFITGLVGFYPLLWAT